MLRRVEISYGGKWRIYINNRICLLDRKFRVINENAISKDHIGEMIKKCYNCHISFQLFWGDSDMTYGEAIKKLRRKMILTQTELAELFFY